jgi:hypothetical protein
MAVIPNFTNITEYVNMEIACDEMDIDYDEADSAYGETDIVHDAVLDTAHD